MVNFHSARFIKSAFSKDDHLHDYPQVLLIGKSNVGKSSLINALTGQKSLAYVSKTPGQTKLVNYYLIDDTFYLVDVPGFGYRKLAYEKDDFEPMMEGYLQDNSRLKVVYYLLDARRDVTAQEEGTIDFMREKGYPVVVIFTKSDKLKQSEKSRLLQQVRQRGWERYHFSSVSSERQLEEVRRSILSHIE